MGVFNSFKATRGEAAAQAGRGPATSMHVERVSNGFRSTTSFEPKGKNAYAEPLHAVHTSLNDLNSHVRTQFAPRESTTAAESKSGNTKS